MKPDNKKIIANVLLAGGIIGLGIIGLGIGGYQYYKQAKRDRLRLRPVALFYSYTSDNRILNRMVELDDKKNLDSFRKMPQFQEVEGVYGDFDDDGDLDFILKGMLGTAYFENIKDDKNSKYIDRGVICHNSTNLEDIISIIKSLKKE